MFAASLFKAKRLFQTIAYFIFANFISVPIAFASRATVIKYYAILAIYWNLVNAFLLFIIPFHPGTLTSYSFLAKGLFVNYA